MNEYDEQMKQCLASCVRFVDRNTDREIDKLMTKYAKARLAAEDPPNPELMLLFQMAMLGLDCARRESPKFFHPYPKGVTR